MKLLRLGHSMLRFESPQGKVIVVDPWIDGNPTCPSLREVDRSARLMKKVPEVDLCLVRYGEAIEQ